MTEENVTESNTVALEPLSPEQLNLLYYIEEHWHRYSKFPSYRDLCDRYLPSFLKGCFEHTTFLYALDNRGITPPVGLFKDSVIESAVRQITTGLTNEQIAAVVVVCNFDDRRSIPAKLRELGINNSKWAGWLKNPDFKNFLQEQSGANLDAAVHIAHEGLIRAVSRGDVNANKFYMELTGRWSPHAHVGTEENLRIIVTRLVESIQRRVKDPEILRLLGQDIEAIMRGETTSEPRQIENTI